jgi:Spy/CpxP family protein refolding chaperone
MRERGFQPAPEGGPGRPRGPQIEPHGGIFGRKPLDFSALNLTEEQRQRIQQIRTTNGARARELQKTLKDRRNQMRDLLFDPGASDEQVRAKRREVRQLQEKLEDMQIADFLTIRKVLSAEQRQRLSEIKSDELKDERAIGRRPDGSGAAPVLRRSAGREQSAERLDAPRP